MEITVKVFKRPVKYNDKVTGKEKTFDALALEFPNGKTMDVRSDKYNYRVVDYLNELLEQKK